jgi:hypothetical protein
MGFIDGSKPVSPNAWEEVRRGGDDAIEKWIANQLDGRSCTVVLIGAETANRPWVIHEIIKSWNLKKGVVGIRVHALKDSYGRQSVAGPNPFDNVHVEDKLLSSIAKVYRPTSSISTEAYGAITSGIALWIDEAIEIRNNYSAK